MPLSFNQKDRSAPSPDPNITNQSLLCARKWTNLSYEDKLVWTQKHKDSNKPQVSPPPMKSKQIKFIVVLNKIDEISMLDSNGDAEFDEEGEELVSQAIEYISKEVDKRDLGQQYLGTNFLCAADAYIYRLYNQNPTVKLDINHINRFGINEYGKRIWSRLTPQQKEDRVGQLMRDDNDSNFTDRMNACGFTNLKTLINSAFSIEHQVTLILHRLGKHIHDTIRYIEGPRGDLPNDIIKWGGVFKVLYRVNDIYDAAGVINTFISEYFTPYINNVRDMYCVILDPNIWTDDVYESQIKYRDDLLLIDNMLDTFDYYYISDLIKNTNVNINAYLEHTSRLSQSFSELFTKLDTLVDNHYMGIGELAKGILFGPSGKITNFEKGFREGPDIIRIINHQYLMFSVGEQIDILKQFIISYLDNVIQSGRDGNAETIIGCQRYLYALRIFTKHNKLSSIGQDFNDLIENLTMISIHKMSIDHPHRYLTSRQLLDLSEFWQRVPEMSIIKYLLSIADPVNIVEPALIVNSSLAERIAPRRLVLGSYKK